MQIQLEAHETHTIQAYSHTEIKINHIAYDSNFIISRDTLITPWVLQDSLNLILDLKPEILIFGTNTPDFLRRSDIIRQFAEKQIGVECMARDAACRTFNLLLSEHRRVVAGFLFEN
ncbi:MAG: MTH938/NDUFAF3 family protein [Legionella sp.]|nr:MTH938/NDUFAF3 family protein [Legionella sp.]